MPHFQIPKFRKQSTNKFQILKIKVPKLYLSDNLFYKIKRVMNYNFNKSPLISINFHQSQQISINHNKFPSITINLY